MDYLLTNFPFEGSERMGQLYFCGNCVKVVDGILKIRESADWRYFGRYAEQLDRSDPGVPIDAEDFCFCLDYDMAKSKILYQTDIIGYEAPFYYFSNGIFALSDDFVSIATCLKVYAGVTLEFDVEKVGEFLLYTEPFFNDTFLKNIFRGEAASICSIDLDEWERMTYIYDVFKMTGAVSDPEQAAKAAFAALDHYFSSHYNPEKVYAIGMSGGLDSRVGAFFANKNHYNLNPIFIGRKSNAFGMLTNDCKRAEEVNTHLGLPPIRYFDPRKTPLSEKLTFEALHAPTVVDNIAQNMGLISGFDCIVNGIIGGEALGALITAHMPEMNSLELAQYMVKQVSNIPLYKSRLSRRIVQLFPYKTVKKALSFHEEWVDEILPKEKRDAVLERVLQWVEEQKAAGLDNINIYHKYFYYRFAVASKYSYYATFNNTLPSICTYLNPVFIHQILSWQSDLLIGKKVQKSLLRKLKGLSRIRSQTVEAAIDLQNGDGVMSKWIRLAERVLRGGGMMYTQWYSPKMLKEEMENRLRVSSGFKRIVIRNVWYKASMHFVFGLMKLTELEQILVRETK